MANIFILITLLFTPIVECEDIQFISSLRGSLIYEQLAFRPITVNPHYFNFYRRFNLTHIQKALDVLDTYHNIYNQFCTQITEFPQIQPIPIMIKNTVVPDTLEEPCLKIGATLPELRTKADYDNLYNFMDVQHIHYTPAGVMIKENKLVYKSNANDLSNVTRLRYCLSCNTETQRSQKDFAKSNDNYFKNPHYFPYYSITPENKIILTPRIPLDADKIVCMRHREIGITTLQLMLKSACKRDSYEIKEQNRLLRIEVERFMSPSKADIFNRLKHSSNINQKVLKKRAAILPIITLSLLGGAASKQSPLDALGSLGASIFGLATTKDLKVIQERLHEHANQINALAINQESITNSINDIQDFIANMSTHVQINTHNMAQIYAELDNKGLIRHLQNLIQLTFLKMQTAVNAATQSLPSPYVFSAKDLRNITQVFRMSDIWLTTNLNDISASVYVADNEYTFLFMFQSQILRINLVSLKFVSYQYFQMIIKLIKQKFKINLLALT